jgi:hypothetical protein
VPIFQWQLTEISAKSLLKNKKEKSHTFSFDVVADKFDFPFRYNLFDSSASFLRTEN